MMASFLFHLTCFLAVACVCIGADKRDGGRRCPPRPVIPEACLESKPVYRKRCIVAYECLAWKQNNTAGNACEGAPTCPPPPSKDCVTSIIRKSINGTRCEWGCRHYCCQDEAHLLTTCPKTSPTNPYCIGTSIVKYTINGRQCPVYCSCVPDCRVLTC